MLDKLKARKKEILICVFYLIIFVIIHIAYNSVSLTHSELEHEEKLLLSKYNNLKNSTQTLEDLQKEENKLIEEINKLNIKLPLEIESELSEIMTEIKRDNPKMNLGRYTVSSATPVDNSKKSKLPDIEKVEVRVQSYSGTYLDIKQFLDYISRYKYKAHISEMVMNEDFGGYKGNLTLVFYGQIEKGE